jgi:hypothetical protein
MRGGAAVEILAVIGAIVIALVTCGAGVWMMRYGYNLTEAQQNMLGFKDDMQTSVAAVKDTVVQARDTIQAGLPSPGPPDAVAQGSPITEATTEHVQAATNTFSGSADYVRGLAELAKNLGDLTPAVSAFVVSTILFFFAGGIVTALLIAAL